MTKAHDLDTLLDLTSDEVAFLADLPADLERQSFDALMTQADKVARSRAGLAAVLQGMHPQTPPADQDELRRIDFRLRSWWAGIANELRNRCVKGRAES